MKKSLLIGAALVAAVAASADIVWKFSPEAVNLARNTVCTPTGNGWTLTQAQKRAEFFSKDMVEIKPDGKYFIRLKVREISPKARLWVVTKNYNADGREFNPTSVDADAQALGFLGSYAHEGATEVKVRDIEKWAPIKRRAMLAFDAKQDDSDLPNSNYYAIKSIAPDGTVTLGKPLRRGYRAGTMVRRHFENGPYDSLIFTTMGADFQVFRRDISGVSEKGREFGKWLRGTAKVRVGIQVEGGDIEIAEFFVSEIAQ